MCRERASFAEKQGAIPMWWQVCLRAGASMSTVTQEWGRCGLSYPSTLPGPFPATAPSHPHPQVAESPGHSGWDQCLGGYEELQGGGQGRLLLPGLSFPLCRLLV